MFCPNCGTELDEGVVFCKQCGVCVQNNVQGNYPDSNGYFEEASNFSGIEITEQAEQQNVFEINGYYPPVEPENPKTGIKKFIIPSAIVVAVIAVIASLVIFCTPVTNFFARIFLPTDKYFSYINKKELESFSGFAGTVADTYHTSNESVKSSKITAHLELTDEGKDVLDSLVGSNSDLINWIDSAEITGDLNSKDGNIGYSFDTKINKQKIMGMDFIIKDNTLYINIPELSDNAFEVDLGDDIGLADSQEILNSLKKVIPSGKTTEKLVNKYAKIVFNDIKDVEHEKTTLSIGGIEQKCHKYTAKIDGDTVYRIVFDVLNELKDDKDVKEIIENLADVIDEDADDFYDELDEYLDELDEDEFEFIDDEDIEYSCWSDNSGKIIARAFTIDDEGIYCGTIKDGKKFEFCFGEGEELFSDEEAEFCISGNGTYKSNKYTGKFKVYVDEEECFNFETVDLNSGDFLTTDKLSGKIILPIGEIVDLVEHSSYSSLMNAYKICIDMDTQMNKKSTVTVSIENGDQKYATLTLFSDPHGNGKIVVPKNTTDDGDDWIESFDFDKLESALDKAGAPSEITDVFDEIKNELSNDYYYYDEYSW